MTITGLCSPVPNKRSEFRYTNNSIIIKAAEGVPVPNPSLAEKGKLMTTYEEFMIILAVAGLIVAILNLKNK